MNMLEETDVRHLGAVGLRKPAANFKYNSPYFTFAQYVGYFIQDNEIICKDTKMFSSFFLLFESE